MKKFESWKRLNVLRGRLEAVAGLAICTGEEGVKGEAEKDMEALKLAQDTMEAWGRVKDEITRLLNADVPTKKSGLIEALYVMNKLDPESEGMKK